MNRIGSNRIESTEVAVRCSDGVVMCSFFFSLPAGLGSIREEEQRPTTEGRHPGTFQTR